MRQFGKELEGKTFSAPNGRSFVVEAIEPYPANKVSPQYREILDMSKGLLVAVPHRGTLIPNITLDGGVARLIQVKVEDETFDRPGAISKALGIKKAFEGHFIGA